MDIDRLGPDFFLGPLLLVGSGGLLYFAVRAIAAAIGVGAAPDRLPLAVALPTALVCLSAAWFGSGALAVGTVFAVSVGALSLVLGTVRYFSVPEPPRRSAQRALLLPVALLALLIGFSGQLTPFHAVLLATEGALLWWLSQGPRPMLPLESPVRARLPVAQGIELLLATAVVLIGAWLGIEGSLRVSSDLRTTTESTMAVVLAVLLLLPVLGLAMEQVQEGRSEQTADAMVKLALLNLCGVLPLVVLLWALAPTLRQTWELLTPPMLASAAPQPDLALWQVQTEPLVFPLTVWRIDTVLLIVLGVLLLPVALGRWVIERHEAIGLIVGFMLYAAAVLIANRA